MIAERSTHAHHLTPMEKRKLRALLCELQAVQSELSLSQARMDLIHTRTEQSLQRWERQWHRAMRPTKMTIPLLLYCLLIGGWGGLYVFGPLFEAIAHLIMPLLKAGG